jgi:hypothetical protein
VKRDHLTRGADARTMLVEFATDGVVVPSKALHEHTQPPSEFARVRVVIGEVHPASDPTTSPVGVSTPHPSVGTIRLVCDVVAQFQFRATT